jgi:diguanylate cyclase (GGDEF)-like protein
MRTGLVTGYLAELRERLGADETIVWRALPDGVLTAAAWSTSVGGPSTVCHLAADAPAARPPGFQGESRMPLVQWAGEQRLVQCARRTGDGDGAPGAPAVTFAAAPVDDARGYCALSASTASGFRVDEERLRAVLAQSAGYVGELLDVLHAHRESERQVRHANVLVNSAKMFQSNRSVDRLAETVCRDAIQIAGGARAALVKWDGGARSGFVQSVSEGHPVAPGQQVVAGSRVAEVCSEDQAQVWEDARQLDRDAQIYGPGETLPGIGSLLIVPMRQEQRVVGAIVVEGSAPGDVQQRDIGPVRTLAAIASASLDHLWRMERVRVASITDQLTHLFNRRHFDDQLTRLLGTASAERPLSLIVADIDHFKRVNDTFGHEAGDAVLQAVAAIVQRALRTGTGGDVAARYGGEEIAILLPGAPVTEALEIAERLRRTIASKPVVHGGQRIPITASFGVASYPETVRAQPALFPSADRALYRAKSEGRNCVKSAGANDGGTSTSHNTPGSRRAVG